MGYRKGERPVVKKLRAYDADHPVAKCIAGGDPWMRAWITQMCTSWPMIAKKTGISPARIGELDKGADPVADEVEKLAVLWWVTPDGLRRSIIDARARIEPT